MSVLLEGRLVPTRLKPEANHLSILGMFCVKTPAEGCLKLRIAERAMQPGEHILWTKLRILDAGILLFWVVFNVFSFAAKANHRERKSSLFCFKAGAFKFKRQKAGKHGRARRDMKRKKRVLPFHSPP